MEHGKRWNYALAASLAFNAACIAVVGDAAARRPAPHSPRSAADALHPKPIQMADAKQNPADGSEAQTKSGNGGQGDGDGGSGSEDAGASGQGRGKGKAGDRKSAARDGAGDTDADGKADAEIKKRLEAIQARTGRLTASQQRQLARAEARLQAREARLASQYLPRAGGDESPVSPGASRERTSAHGGLPLRTASAQTGSEPLVAAAHRALSTDGPSGMNAPTDQAPPTTMKSGTQPTQTGDSGAASRKMTIVTQPSSPVKNAHGSAGGSSMSPKMVKYGKMKVDLGTIHMTRPKGPVTGGGLSDQRDVEITAHYVIDDLKNQPKHLKPDKFLKLFPPNCNGDPGNKSKCVPTGGNTRLGGGTLHGRHDHITGMKYCVPGSGGLPSAGSPAANSQSSSHGGPRDRSGGGKPGANNAFKTYGGLRGERAIVSQPYRGPSPENNFQTSYWQNGALNPNEPMAQVAHPMHLPAQSDDNKTMTPGGEVPVADRKWVENPMEHTESAPPSEKPSPLARFRVSPRNIGSLSQFGTVNWAPPSKTVRKKQPYGGDGSGLLGLYYKGNNFDEFVFKKPDRNIDFDWSSGPPDPRLPRNQEYSVRWLGKLVPKVTDRYTISTGSDDGVRLYVDGRLVISNWTIHGPAEDTATMTLEAGRAYSIKLEYYENGYGFAAMKLYWESASVPREYIPESCLKYPKARELQ